MRLRRALPEEAAEITALAIESKAHWGYDEPAMEIFRPELTFEAATLMERSAHVIEDDRAILGFYTLALSEQSSLSLDSHSVELEHLYVRRGHFRKGVGTLLLDHAIDAASSLGARRLVIQSDPNAQAFYAKAGARLVAMIPTSIPGRELPLMELFL